MMASKTVQLGEKPAPEASTAGVEQTQTTASGARSKSESAASKFLAAGQTIAGRYMIREILGQGEQAKVYRVQDLELDEEVALKVLTGRLSNNEGAVDQFKQEIRLARRIVHPNVGRNYDFGRWNDLLFVTMELIPGVTLADVLKNGDLGDLDQRLELFRDILVGLRSAHAKGVIHRDIKPGNIMVTPEGQAVVLDFGLAGEEETGRAGGGSVLGTPAYIAPERLQGVVADPRSDIYSLGVLFFELLTGKKPFGGSVVEVIQQHLHATPPRVKDLVPDIPESLDLAVATMLAKLPDERYSSVDTVLEVVAEIRSTPVGRSVLLAEKNEDTRALMSHLLGEHGFAVTETGDGERTIELLLREKPDLIVLDADMPKIDGFRIAEMIKHFKHLVEVPVYIVSRVCDPSHLAYARQLGVVRMIQRPFAVRCFARDLLADVSVT